MGEGEEVLVEMGRESADQAIAKLLHEHHDEKPDWKGTCHYCKQKIVGTVAELLEHRCREYEAHCEQSR